MAWLALLLGGCSTPPCEPDELPTCADCGPGGLRGGATFGAPNATHPASFATASGIACVSCGTIYRFPGGPIHADLTDTVGFATASTGEMYSILKVTPPYDPREEPEPPSTWSLLALDDAGNERWRVELAVANAQFYVEAGPEGPYVVRGNRYTGGLLSAYSTDATLRWTRMFSDRIMPDGQGGLYILDGNTEDHGTTVTGSITLLDGITQVERWTRALVAHNANTVDNASVYVTAATATETGELVIGGELSGFSLDIGDRTITTGSQHSQYVAALDSTGATRWAFPIEGPTLQLPAITSVGGKAVLTGMYKGDGGTLSLPSSGYNDDTCLAVFDETGLVRVHQIGGDQVQPSAIGRDADGSVWLAVDVVLTDPHGVELAVGGRAFEPGEKGRHTYVLNMLP